MRTEELVAPSETSSSAGARGVPLEGIGLEMASVRRRQIEIDGHSIHYLDEGDGPPLLFVHAGTGSFLWHDVIVRLRGRFRCVALDVPGAGVSRSDEGRCASSRILESFVRTLDLNDLTLVLHDLGGPVGIALRQHERIQALVVTESFGWPLGRDRFVGLPDAALTDDDLREVDRTLRTVLNDRPVLLVFGQESPMVKARFHERWRERFPDAGLLLVEGSRRFPMVDAPDLVARAIKGWWQEEVFAA